MTLFMTVLGGSRSKAQLEAVEGFENDVPALSKPYAKAEFPSFGHRADLSTRIRVQPCLTRAG